MIKFVAVKDGKPVLGLGLSRLNIERLTSGEPIIVEGKDVELPELGKVLIFFGETEVQIAIDLARAGLVDGDTKIRGHTNAIDDPT